MLTAIHWRRATPVARAGDELGEPGEADRLPILAVPAGKDRPARNSDQALAGRGRKRPVARQAASLHDGNL